MKCKRCGRKTENYYNVDCNGVFCSECWNNIILPVLNYVEPSNTTEKTAVEGNIPLSVEEANSDSIEKYEI